MIDRARILVRNGNRRRRIGSDQRITGIAVHGKSGRLVQGGHVTSSANQPDQTSMTHVLQVQQLPEIVIADKRLGRNINHDERSRRYSAPVSDQPLHSVRHLRYVPVFDQGDVGSCTGNAALGALGTEPLYEGVSQLGVTFNEQVALRLYSQATLVDPFEGAYLPTDTGSDGLSVAKVLHSNGWISGYQHALSFAAVLTALQTAPVIAGIGWYEGFDTPDQDGVVTLSGQLRGGHEIVLDGIDVERQLLWATNSWSPSWGVNGTFAFTWNDFKRLLANDGDVTILIPHNQDAPTPGPVPDPTTTLQDYQLIAAMDPWQKTIWSRVTKAGKAKEAYLTWKRNKGYAS